MISKWARDSAIMTWDRISNSRTNNSLKLYETTITQNLTHELYELKLDNVRIEEAEDEAANGNDLELYIQNSYTKEFKHFAVQAKISKNEIYQTINHHKNNSFQISDLISYSKKIRAIPLYFLYSHTNKYNGEELHRKGFTYNEYGITVTGASRIFWDFFDWNPNVWKFKKIPTVCEIIEDNNSFTFREFLCNQHSQEQIENSHFEPTAFVGASDKILYKNYNFGRNEIPQDNKWKIIQKQINEIEISNDSNSFSFNPKYRIIIEN